jgi:hypothetical protein
MKTEWVGGDVYKTEVLYAVVKDEDNMMFASTRSLECVQPRKTPEEVAGRVLQCRIPAF